MSLVNQMLKDLEQRRADLPAADSLAGLRAAPTSAPSRRSVWLGTVAIMFMAGTGVVWFTANGNREVSAAAVTEPVTAMPTGAVTGAEPAQKVVPEKTEETIAVAPSANSSQPSAAAGHPAAPVVHRKADDTRPQPPRKVTPPAKPVPAAPEPAPEMRKVVRALTAAEQAERHYADALGALQQNDVRKAEVALREALALANDHAQAAEHYAALLMNQSRTAEAQEVLRSTLALNAGHPRLSKLLARLLADEQRDVEALALLQGARNASQNDSEYFALVGALSQRQQDHSTAAAAYRRALTLDPRRGTWWMGLGISLERLQQSQDALKAYQAAINDSTLSAAVIAYLQGRIDVLGNG